MRFGKTFPAVERFIWASFGWRSLGTLWAVILGSVAAGGIVLQVLGPPESGTAGPSTDRHAPRVGPAAPARPAVSRPSASPISEAARHPSASEIALLEKAEAEIAENPAGLPPRSKVSAETMLPVTPPQLAPALDSPAVSPPAAALRSPSAPPTEATPGTPQPARSDTPPTEGKVAMTVVPLAPPAANPPAPPAPLPPVIQQPQMVLLSGGRFLMGSHEDPSEEPQHFVQVRPFWISKYSVTAGEWRACVAAGGCEAIAGGTDEPDKPISNVSWLDAMSYVKWLARTSGLPYRLPSEAEWEYAARAGSTTRYWWGNEVGTGHANCRGCDSSPENAGPRKVGSFAPNRFGLFDMGGGIAEWVADCWHANYAGAPASGAAWECQTGGDHVLRGGSWMSTPSIVRASDREHYETSVRYPGNGFRVARSE